MATKTYTTFCHWYRGDGLPTTVWVVAKPKPGDTLSDIAHGTSLLGLVMIGRGGQSPGDVYGIYADEGEAYAVAKQLLTEAAEAA